MGDIVLFVDDLQKSCAIPHCRICHEAEFESCKSLEAPCACSGTVKNYEPGFTAPTKKCEMIEPMTIRDSLEIPRREHDPENQELGALAADERATAGAEYSHCTSAADRSAACCRYLALTFTVLMLLKHLFATLTGGTEDYPFTLVTQFIKAFGYQYQDSEDDEDYTSSSDGDESEDQDEHHHRLV
ncbi:hypothetical protein OIU84_016406 [Salix udensis]|uniref:Uncharacterized protein n=1 Tax=Salix udensis TaxID=889485 RepID=A0AAD6JBA7_9ROSI|nr:hypothetical protein OIU84_016406 [Salix udensis]